jgi:hypothetical protein
MQRCVFLAGFSAACVLASGIGACSAKPPPPPLSAGRMTVVSPATPAEHTYTTRAVITGLPGKGALYLQVHHEAIPEFVNKAGETTGMKEMIMEMPAVTPAVNIAAHKAGDKVAKTVFNLSPIVEEGK